MSFTEIAEKILRDAKTLDNHIARQNLPRPSIDANGPAFSRVKDPEASIAHANLLENVHLAQHLALGPASAWNGTMNGATG
jgi:hypothetical protein